MPTRPAGGLPSLVGGVGQWVFAPWTLAQKVMGKESVVRVQVSRPDPPGIPSQSCLLMAVWLWERNSASLGFCLLIQKSELLVKHRTSWHGDKEASEPGGVHQRSRGQLLWGLVDTALLGEEAPTGAETT